MSAGISIVGATLGDCVHVAGVLGFLRLAEGEGYHTDFLGTQVTVDEIISTCQQQRPDIVALSYRLSPESARPLLGELLRRVEEAGLADTRFAFGGTAPVCEIARATGLFEVTFDGAGGPEQVLGYLRGEALVADEGIPPQTLVRRIEAKAPFPLIRHHYGRPTLRETERGIEEIAESRVLDILSLGPDHNAQSAFFRPEEQDPGQDGAGGVPVRRAGDLVRLHAASRRGNYPLMRCYSGTRDVFRMAGVLRNTIGNAWCAVPLFWYNVLDGRGPRSLRESIAEAQELMRWHADMGIPVEVNEAHHWSLRDAHDTVAVAAAYLAAHNARAAGVSDYIAQYMFNTPPGTSADMDLAKMLAKVEMIESLADDSFRVWRQVRSGLFSFPADEDRARGQLAYSTLMQMAIRPHIVHVVSFSEADHAATASDVMGSCKMAEQVIENCLAGLPDMRLDPAVQDRKRELLRETELLLDAIRALAPEAEDPLTDPEALSRAVEVGYMDAPHLAGNPVARGELQTCIVGGACRAVDPQTGEPVDEARRLAMIDEQRI
ncbi:MAG: cobalamin B12-binding domain-containing protein [Bacillota bacterium]